MEKKTEKPDTKKPVIMFVEDEGIKLLAIEQQLEKAFGEDFAVEVFSRIKKAREFFLANRERVRLLLTDLDVAGESGADFSREVRNLLTEEGREKLKIIFATGGDRDVENQKDAEQYHPDGFLRKPFATRELIAVVGKQLGIHLCGDSEC